MSQASFAYAAPANDAVGLPLALSVFADRPHLRAEMREDAEAAGFRIVGVSEVASLLEGEARALGEVVLLDCPDVNGTKFAALARLDMRAAHCGAHLVVSTSAAALDDVFACLDQSNPQILVNPSRAERVIALGHVLARVPELRVGEFFEEDRLVWLRLTEQVGQIAGRLERLSAPAKPAAMNTFRFQSPSQTFDGQDDDGLCPPLPDPRLVRRIIRQRQLRARFFDGDLFADPAWDMLLDLTIARAENQRVSVSSLCIASGVPPTTALRWIGQMTEAGLFQRIQDDSDRRRAFIALTDSAADAMAHYFAELGSNAARMV